MLPTSITNRLKVSGMFSDPQLEEKDSFELCQSSLMVSTVGIHSYFLEQMAGAIADIPTVHLMH